MGTRGSRLLRSEYREAFERDLQKLHERSGPWDLVLISGDLTLSGHAREFSVLSSTLDSLWSYLQSLGSTPCLLTVPGNHDLWRGHHSWSAVSGTQYRLSEVNKAIHGSGKPETAQRVWGGLTPFNDWFNNWRQAHPSPLLQDFRKGLLPGDFAATVSKGELSVGVVGLNSIFGSDAKGGYEIDLEQVEEATTQSAREWAGQHDFVLLLTHHPPSRLDSKQLGRLQAALTPPSGFLLHLCGSRRAEGVSFLSLSGRSCVVQASSLFGGTGPAARASHWGFFAGGLEASTDRLRLFPRAVSSTQGPIQLGPDNDGRWVLGADEALGITISALSGKKTVGLPSAPGTQGPPQLAMLGTAADRGWAVAPELRLLEEEPTATALPPGVSLQMTLRTGTETVGWLAWAPSGDALGIGLSSGHIAYWETGAPKPRWMVQGYKTGVTDLCFSPDGRMLASRSHHHVHLWQADGTRIPTPKPLRKAGAATAWSSTGLLAADIEQGSIVIWSAQASTMVRRGEFHNALDVVHSLTWSPDGRILVCGGDGASSVTLLDVGHKPDAVAAVQIAGLFPRVPVLDIAWMPGSSRIAMACRDGTVHIWDTRQDILNVVSILEGHTDAVTSVSFSFDGRLLASKALDGTVRLWRTDSWELVARLEEPTSPQSYSGLAFSPTKHALASLGAGGRGVRLWDLDVATLLRTRAPAATVHEVSAKVVLVGEGRAGKSCLALRMVKDEYEELESTHGMRFWSMPVEPSTARGSASGPKREIVLWDLGGQSEYQLVHQLFLRDSTVALMVMEPGRGVRALEEVEGWNRRLLAQAGERNIRKLLVGTKVDNPEAPVNVLALEELVGRLGFESHVLTSARKGQGISELKAALGRTIDWDAIEQVSRPELFQRIRQLIQRLREARRVVLSFSELERELRREMGSAFDLDALQAVVGHLTRQGRVADTRMGGGTRVLILEVEQLERYAGSLIVAARENPHGVPAIEVAKVLSPKMKFPRIPGHERLPEDQELPVLNCVIELLIEHGLCLRHEGLLIFPSLFQPSQSEAGADFSHAISLHYDFFGPIDNIYASLVTSLAVSQRFGPMRLWENRAEFGQAGKDSSGVRRVQSRSQGARGIAQLDVFFDEGTDSKTRELFVNFVEQHLHEQGVELLERLSVTCVCGRIFSEESVRSRLTEGKPDIGCETCDRRTPLTLGAQQARALNPELVKQVQALRTTIKEQRSQSVTETKVNMTEAQKVKQKQDAPIRILHLSDLHIGAGDDPLTLLQPLSADLQDASEGLGVERLDYLVISGDITNRAAPQEFEKAREFVSGLIEQFGLTAERCIIVPGNHDLDWDTEVYTWKKKRQVDVSRLTPGTFREAGDGYHVRDEAKYPERFKNFSQHFYHPLIQKAYPLEPDNQCIPFLFSESRLQFLTMNSAWEIDEYFRERSSISEKALVRGLSAANQDLLNARKRGELASDARVLRLSVWHHPITGNEKIQSDAFLGQLLKAEVRVCLHGHVHEDRADLVNYLHSDRRLHVVGAGSFGAPTHERPESVPRLFNLLEVQRDLQTLRVHTRALRKRGGAWEGWAVWPGAKPGEKRTYYDVTLP